MKATEGGGCFLTWKQHLCTSSSASWRIGPFESREQAWEFQRMHINGTHKQYVNYDNETVIVVNELSDYTPEEFLREVPAEWEVEQ